MFDLALQNYIDFKVHNVFYIKNSFGFRVILIYQDGSVKIQQFSGYNTKKAAMKVREKTIAELYSGTYIVYKAVKVKEFLNYWLEEDIRKRVGSYNSYDTYARIVRNHIIPAIGTKKMTEVSRSDIYSLYSKKARESKSIVKQIKTILNTAFAFAVSKKVISVNVVKGVNLPKSISCQENYHCRKVDAARTLSMEQVMKLIRTSKNTKIYMMVLFNVMMGLRCSEIIAVKYSDIDYVDHTLHVHCQLGRALDRSKDELPSKEYTKQEVKVKTRSSDRVLPIPDMVFEAIMEERERYEKRRRRRGAAFQDLDYIVCSSYGRPRSKNFHFPHFKTLLKECGLPDIRWHDLRSTYCTLLLKNDFSPKAVSKLMGHSKEIVTVDVYADKTVLAYDALAETEDYFKSLLPDEEESCREDILNIVIDVSPYLPEE